MYVYTMKVSGREVSQSVNHTEHCVSEVHGHSPYMVTYTHTCIHALTHANMHTQIEMYQY